jgi:hypothetical protein
MARVEHKVRPQCPRSRVPEHVKGRGSQEKRRFRVREWWDSSEHSGATESGASDAAKVRSRSEVRLAAGLTLHFAASDRPSVRSHVPGMTRDRAQADEAGIRKAKPFQDSCRSNPPMGRLQEDFGP